MYVHKFFFFLLTLVISGEAFSQTFKPCANPEKVLADLRTTSQATTSIQAGFREEKFLAVLKEPEKSSGMFYYQQKDKMRWEQKSPAKYVILINGDKLRVQQGDKEKNVGQAGRMAAQIKELMIGLVNGDFQQNKAFSISCEESESQYRVVLLPTNKRLRNIYSKISLTFAKSSLRLKELGFFEKGGDRSVMHFENEKFNQALNSSLFENL